MQKFQPRDALMPFILSLAFVAGLAIYYWGLLPVGHIQQGDEYITLDRVHSFLIRNDYWTVFSYNQPSFNKPPLQYWISAYLIQEGADLEFSLRFPSLLFGVLTLINAGILAYLIYPANPWVAPAAIALLAGSSSFWRSNISAMLDSGAMLFCTLAITSCLLAFSRPRWWYLVAMAVALGALQKAPVPLLFVVAMVLIAFVSKGHDQNNLRTAFLNRHFFIATGLAFAAVLLWPALQWVQFGPASFHQAYVNQIVERFSPFGNVGGRRRGWDTVLLSGEQLLRIPAIASLLALPWVLRRFDLLSLPLLWIIFAITTLFASGYISPRYSLVFMPLLMAALAVVLIKFLPGRVWPVLVIGALAVSEGGPVESANTLHLFNDDQQKFAPLLQNIAQSLRENETLIVCRSGPGLPRIARGAISYYASNGRPFKELKSPDQFLRLTEDQAIVPPYRGICHTQDFQKLRRSLENYEIVEESNEYVHWKGR
jgi:4-amino-4-deoxy-L-arabinose transferase-like glycosyltransferase